MKIHTMDDSFTVNEDVDVISRRIVDHLSSAGFGPTQTQDGIQVRAGSDILFRLLGFLLAPNSFPVGLDVHVAEVEEGASITSSAYDRLGWYVNKKPLWGQDVVDRRLTEMLNGVRTAVGKPELPKQSSTFNP